jgi:hypothetical protein
MSGFLVCAFPELRPETRFLCRFSYNIFTVLVSFLWLFTYLCPKSLIKKHWQGQQVLLC